jgi:hypothetical protein
LGISISRITFSITLQFLRAPSLHGKMKENIYDNIHFEHCLFVGGKGTQRRVTVLVRSTVKFSNHKSFLDVKISKAGSLSHFAPICNVMFFSLHFGLFICFVRFLPPKNEKFLFLFPVKTGKNQNVQKMCVCEKKS